MDMSQLALEALAVATPYLVKGGEEVSAEMGKDVWTYIKGLFKSDNEAQLIHQYEQSPGKTTLQSAIQDRLNEILLANPVVADQLDGLIKGSSIATKQNTQNIKGNGNFSFQDLNNSSISINKGDK